MKRSWNTRNLSVPAVEIAAIMFVVKRSPVPLTTGVSPTGDHDVPVRDRRAQPA